MVIQCQSCKGLLRCDPAAAAGDMAHRIRCPHCGREGFIHKVSPLERDAAAETLTPEPDLDKNILLDELGGNRQFHEKELLWAQQMHQGSRGEVDAISGMRTPLVAKPKASGVNWVRWIVASFAVIIAFALFVNLVLPGPSGHKFFGGVTYQNQERGAGTPDENRQK